MSGRFQLKQPCMVGPFEFVFLNKRMVIDPKAGWSDSSREALWNYNLHYFDDLNAIDSCERKSWHQDYIAAWIAANPIGVAPAWDSYPTSLRIVNWIKYLVRAGDCDVNVVESLSQQSQWLSQRIEHHLQANHLWANAKSLVFAGLYFECKESEVWLNKGIKLVQRELNEQVLDDGGHYERSPMYHAIVLEDILDLLQINRVYSDVLPESFGSILRQKAEIMLQWLGLMSHGNGRLCFFNDTTNGVALTLDQLKTYAEELGICINKREDHVLSVLDSSGYVVASREEATLFCKVAPIEPAYQPGHAHADTLSFELSIDAQVVFCNSGINTYSTSPERSYQRGTSSHNTVEVDGENSSEIWQSFRVARRANPFDLAANKDGASTQVSCKHDGYLRLGGGVIHHREWSLYKDSLQIVDQLSGEYEQAVGRVFLHPDVGVEHVAESEIALNIGLRSVRVRVDSGELRVKPAKHFPGFGLCEETHCLEVWFNTSFTDVRVTWGH